MKKCSQCGQVYNDASLNFCLTDGAPLIDTISQSGFNVAATPVNPSNPLAAILKYGAIAIVAMVFAGVVVAFLYERNKNNANPDDSRRVAAASDNRKANDSTEKMIPGDSPKPTPSGVVKSLPVSNAANTAPSVAPKANKFKVINTSDGFTTVRASPKTSSAAKGTLYPGTEVVCESVAHGEKFDGSTAWRYCPAVGGYIHSKLLVSVASK